MHGTDCKSISKFSLEGIDDILTVVFIA